VRTAKLRGKTPLPSVISAKPTSIVKHPTTVRRWLGTPQINNAKSMEIKSEKTIKNPKTP